MSQKMNKTANTVILCTTALVGASAAALLTSSAMAAPYFGTEVTTSYDAERQGMAVNTEDTIDKSDKHAYGCPEEDCHVSRHQTTIRAYLGYEGVSELIPDLSYYGELGFNNRLQGESRTYYDLTMGAMYPVSSNTTVLTKVVFEAEDGKATRSEATVGFEVSF